MSENLVTSNRGFGYFEESVQDAYGAEITVYESSSIIPSIWVEAAQDEANVYGTSPGSVILHLALDEAEKLRDQLTVLIDDLYSQL